MSDIEILCINTNNTMLIKDQKASLFHPLMSMLMQPTSKSDTRIHCSSAWHADESFYKPLKTYALIILDIQSFVLTILKSRQS